MMGFYIFILLLICIFALAIGARFGEEIHDGVKNVKDIYIKDDFDGEKESEVSNGTAVNKER